MLRSSVLAALGLVLFSFSNSSLTDEKMNDYAIEIASQNCTNGNDILMATKFNSSKYCAGNSVVDVLNAFPTIVHETYHHHNYEANNDPTKRVYFVNRRNSITINRFPVFNSSELKDFVHPEYQKALFRFGEYINSDNQDMDSQKNGIFGIMEEYAAYYQDILAYQEMYGYLRKNVPDENTQVWVDYLIKNSNVLVAGYEFELFISWYLQFAQQNHPEVYTAIITNDDFKKLYTMLHDGHTNAVNKHLSNQETILTSLGNKVVRSGDFVKVAGDKYFYKLPNNDIDYPKQILAQNSEHEILDKIYAPESISFSTLSVTK